MYLVINKCVTAVKVSNFSDHYLRNRSTLDIGVLGYIGIVQHKENSPEVLSIYLKRHGFSRFLLVFCFQGVPAKYQLLNLTATDKAVDCRLQVILRIGCCREI